MKMKKQLMALAVVAMLSCSAVGSVFAAGIGYVNFNALVDAHKDTPKAIATMQADVKKAQDDFNQQVATLATDKEKAALAQQLNKQLMQTQSTLLDPILADVKAKVEEVRKTDDLDCIVDQGAIISGVENAKDVTADVMAKIK